MLSTIIIYISRKTTVKCNCCRIYTFSRKFVYLPVEFIFKINEKKVSTVFKDLHFQFSWGMRERQRDQFPIYHSDIARNSILAWWLFLFLAYLKFLEPNLTTGSYCKLNYGLPTQLVYTKTDLQDSPELEKNSPYNILYDVIEGKLGEDKPGVTYVTHLTKDFLLYISEVVR